MNSKIVVMGGSFNPPTIAHYALMQAALDGLGAQKGIFVPVSFAYLKRKMMRSGSTFCLSEDLRAQMLESMCRDDARMSVSRAEYGLPMARTYDTLMEMQKQDPEAKLYFVMGADKLKLMQDFAGGTDYFKHFYLAVFSREGVDAGQMVREDPLLAPYADRFAFLSSPEVSLSVSSTAVREAITRGGDYSALVHPGVAELLKTVSADDFAEEITRFKDEYAFLDNLFPAPVEWEGITYPCVEAAFQASKTDDPQIRLTFAKCKPDRIKDRGNRLAATEQWSADRLKIMKELLLLKFRSHSGLAKQLKATGGKTLINGNNGKDPFWGTSLYTWDGGNKLGQLLMEIRNEL